MTIKQNIRLYWFHITWKLRDTVAAILQDIARWIAP